jgi:hypothetical protein
VKDHNLTSINGTRIGPGAFKIEALHPCPPTTMTHLIAGKSLDAWLHEFPLLRELQALSEVSWFNPAVQPAAQALPGWG